MHPLHPPRLFLWLLLLLGCGGLGLAAQPGLPGPDTVAMEREKTVSPNLPPQRVRTMAEWEEAAALVIAWSNPYRTILTEIVRAAREECQVYILATDPTAVYFYLQTQGVSLNQVQCLTASYNSVWIRDYGPWTVYQQEVASRGISDFLYNRPLRLADDLVPYELADYLDMPLFNADENPYRWVHTGGNFLPDGLDNAYSSDLVLRENSGKTGQEIAGYAETFFGIKDYRILARLNYDTIHHLDMHLRLLDEETIAVGTYPAGVADGPQIEANLAFITNHYRTPYGQPYRILRLPMPPHNGQYPPLGDYRTYTNSVFVNGSILVPTYASPFDTTALRLYREYFPGYRVVGINCNEIIDELGALHCITKLVGATDPLWIAHQRLHDTYATGAAFPVTASLHHVSGIAEATLYYRIAPDTAYLALPMAPDPDEPDQWQATIPPQPAGTTVAYYLEAVAHNGQRQRRPLPAPVAYYPFRVQAYTQRPAADWVQDNPEIASGTSILFSNTTRHGDTVRYWTFPGGQPVFATTAAVQVTYPDPGMYPVRLVAANPLGSDTLQRPGAVRVRETFPPAAADFNAGPAPQWEAVAPGTEPFTWQWSAGNACTGGYLVAPHRTAPEKLNRAFLRTGLDLRGYTDPALTFAVAYAIRNPEHFDELRVNLVDATGKHLNIYNKGGDVLATVPGAVPDFVPADCTPWRTETVSLATWTGQQLILEFETIGDRGNSVYLDDIHVRANALPQAAIAYPAAGTWYVGNGDPLTQTARVTATDTDGTVARVDFFLGSNYLGFDETDPYERPFTLPAWGQYCLQARVTDDLGAQTWTPPTCVQYDFQSGTTSETEGPLQATLQPNPVRDQAVLQLTTTTAYANLQLAICDGTGRRVRQWTQDVGVGTTAVDLPVANLAAGFYSLQIVHDGQQWRLPWVKL